jgi:inosose dehydratase
MPKIKIGCGQLTWPHHVVESQVLAEIAQAGYDGAPVDLRLDLTSQATIALYAQYGLQPAPGYFSADFWRPGLRQMILQKARSAASWSRQVGCRELYVACGGFENYQTARGKSRSQIAGQVQPQDGLTEDEWKTFAANLNAVGRVTLEEGVASCYHNHVGSLIETEAEFEQLLSMVDPELVFLGPDTGHLAWAGADVVAFCRRHIARIRTMHIKDIVEAVRLQGVAQGWTYTEFADQGIFTELGEGEVNFPALLDLLRGAGFEGWLIVETDVTHKPSALESAQVSHAYLRSLGLD